MLTHDGRLMLIDADGKTMSDQNFDWINPKDLFYRDGHALLTSVSYDSGNCYAMSFNSVGEQEWTASLSRPSKGSLSAAKPLYLIQQTLHNPDKNGYDPFLWGIDADGTVSSCIPAGTLRVDYPFRIADRYFVATDERDWSLWLIEADGTKKSKLSQDKGFEDEICFSQSTLIKLYSEGGGAELLSLDQTGNVAWRYNGIVVLAGPVVVDAEDVVCYGWSGRSYFAVRLDKTGKEVWRTGLGSEFAVYTPRIWAGRDNLIRIAGARQSMSDKALEFLGIHGSTAAGGLIEQIAFLDLNGSVVSKIEGQDLLGKGITIDEDHPMLLEDTELHTLTQATLAPLNAP